MELRNQGISETVQPYYGQSRLVKVKVSSLGYLNLICSLIHTTQCIGQVVLVAYKLGNLLSTESRFTAGTFIAEIIHTLNMSPLSNGVHLSSNMLQSA